MKNLLFLALFVFCTSFETLPESKTLPNGRYTVVLDQSNKGRGFEDFEIVIQDLLFTSIIKISSETLELEWISDTAFIVKGFTEPKINADILGYVESSDKNAFHINKHEGDAYYFHLGTKTDANPVFTGKLVLQK
ncbi:hypothetical protein [Flavobacterium sp.]